MREQMLTRLLADGFVVRTPSGLRATRRWQAAMARASLRLLRAGEDGDDLRVPIAAALIELYGGELDDTAIAATIAIMLPIVQAELAHLRVSP